MAPAEQARERWSSRASRRSASAVLDSATACGGHGLVAIAAANAAAAGADLAEVAAAARRRCATSMKILFAVDTLEFLRRGGRIGSAQAYLGSALQDQADPHASRAEIEPVERVRTSGRAVAGA